MTRSSITLGNKISGGVGLTAVAVLVGGIAHAAPVLPGPEFATQYDDGLSYSIAVLDYFFPDDGWDAAAGTGSLDILLTTRSSGQSNPDPFPDPTTNPNTTPIEDMWGGITDGDPLLVQEVLDYLVTNFNTTVPQFTFDQNETGGEKDLFVTAKVDIIDGDGTTILHTWAFDGIDQAGDGDYDAADTGNLADPAWVQAPGSITVIDPDTGLPVELSANVGSGKSDYVVVAPTMDLTPWADADNLFKVTWQFADVDNGGEEIFLTGRFNEQPPRIPEPTTITLLGLGLLALFGVRRRGTTGRA